MRFVVFGEDGLPKRVGGCPDYDLFIQAKEGETVVGWLSEDNPVNYRLIDGEITRIEEQ